MCSALESLAKKSVSPGLGADLSTPMFTLHFSGLLAKLGQQRFSWKTPQCSLFEDLDNFCGTWPQWGMMRSGECYALTMRDYHIIEPGFGWLPTPSGTSNHGKNHVAGAIEEWGGSWNSLRGTAIGKRKSQELEELLLGYPVGWTDLTPFEIHKFQQWLNSHGQLSHNNEPKIMTLAERDRKLKCLEDILEQPRDDQNQIAIALFKIWHDGLWEVSDDSFDEFLQNEFEMTETDAFIVMKAAASAGQFPDYEAEKINEEFERFG